MKRGGNGQLTDGSRLYNKDAFSITNSAILMFFRQIEDELKKGYGFVPFIGAGLSAPSGVPLVWEIKLYLERCIVLALGVEEAHMRPWNPRADQWPPFLDQGRTNVPEGSWLRKVRDQFESRRERDRWDPELPVFQEAIGAMAEWRTALLFLSRLIRESQPGTKKGGILVLDAPRQEVVDACLREVLKDKRPTLGHRMLASIADLLRLQTILTTNFDDLLEQAFARAGAPLTPFDIQLHSTLPPWSALARQRSLIKLHGDRHSLRADYTLDALPSEADRWTFLEYLVAEEKLHDLHSSRMRDSDHPGFPLRNHLLVMGFSAAERRTRALIEHAWLHLSHDFKVMWLCHSSKDVNNVSAFTRGFKDKHKNTLPSSWEGSRVLRHRDLGLLFLHLYQWLRKGIPTTGLVFPSVSRLALPPLSAASDVPSRSRAYMKGEEFKKRLRKHITSFQTGSLERHKLLAVSSRPRARGVTSLCAQLFDDLQDTGSICLWLDMNDISSTDDLFEQLLEAAHYRLGVENWMPLFVAKAPRQRADEIKRLTQLRNAKWVIFLNARETPAANYRGSSPEANYRGSSPEQNKKRPPNDWIDIDLPPGDVATSDSYSKSQGSFLDLLSELCGVGSPSIAVVLLYRQHEGETAPIITALSANGMIDEPELLDWAYLPFNIDDVVCKAIAWTEGLPARRRFLHALCLMQRTRFLGTLWSPAVLPPNEDQDTVLDWIESLEKRSLVRWKPGGFIWMHTLARNTLRDLLSDPDGREFFIATHARVEEHLSTWRGELAESALHFQLSAWYQRVFAATRAPAALFEVVYHACLSAETRLTSAAAYSSRATSHESLKEALREARERIGYSSALLQTNSFLIQTQGYSRGRCRRLDYVRSDVCKRLDATLDSLVSSMTRPAKDVGVLIGSVRASCHLLKIRACEVMRAVAREVGEDWRAYERKDQIGYLLAGHEPPNARNKGARQKLAPLLFSSLFRNKKPERTKLSEKGNESKEDRQDEQALQWIRWWRWLGMLALASRPYDQARRALLKALASCVAFGDLPRSAKYPLGHRIERDDEAVAGDVSLLARKCLDGSAKVLGHPLHSHQGLRLELIRVVEQLVAQQLLTSSLNRRKYTSGEEVPAWTPADTTHLRSVIAEGLALAEQIAAHDQSADGHDTMQAFWCKSRLLMHDAICCALLGKWVEAMRALSDSDACLNRVGDQRRGAERAYVELHRAEVYLRQAAAMENVLLPDGRLGRFDEMTLMLRGWMSDGPEDKSLRWRTRGESLRKLFDDKTASGDKSTSSRFRIAKLTAPMEALRRVKALLKDAVRCLERAESLLLDRRRNVWWTTWLFQRKMTAIAMTMWATTFEQDTPIPHLGLEAAPRKTPTVADALLKQAVRMSRVDAYRLATIIDEYVSCTSALYVRLLVDVRATRLPERQTSMSTEIANAVSHLEHVIRQRTEGGARVADATARGDDDHGAMKPEIETYIRSVIRRATDANKYLRHALLGETESASRARRRRAETSRSATTTFPAATDQM